MFQPPFLRQVWKKRSSKWQSGEPEFFLDEYKVFKVNKEISRTLRWIEEMSNCPGQSFYRKVDQLAHSLSVSLPFISCEFHADISNLKVLGERRKHTPRIDVPWQYLCVGISFVLSLGLP